MRGQVKHIIIEYAFWHIKIKINQEMGLFIKTADKSQNPQKRFFGAPGKIYFSGSKALGTGTRIFT